MNFNFIRTSKSFARKNKFDLQFSDEERDYGVQKQKTTPNNLLATKGESNNSSSKVKDADQYNSSERINPQSVVKKKRTQKSKINQEFSELGE